MLSLSFLLLILSFLLLLLMLSFFRAIYFASYSNLKLLCNSHACPNTWKVHLLSALGAGT